MVYTERKMFKSADWSSLLFWLNMAVSWSRVNNGIIWGVAVAQCDGWMMIGGIRSREVTWRVWLGGSGDWSLVWMVVEPSVKIYDSPDTDSWLVDFGDVDADLYFPIGSSMRSFLFVVVGRVWFRLVPLRPLLPMALGGGCRVWSCVVASTHWVHVLSQRGCVVVAAGVWV
jgi:hypothetical protein